MASAVIGALRVELSLNSAQFTTGLKQSQSKLSVFGKSAGLAMAGLATAAVGAAAAIGGAVKQAADHADKLLETSQKVGVSVEALSQLEYQAKFSSVSLDGLSTGLRKLADNMADFAMNSKAGVGVAFKALAIDVKDASGNLRSGDQVFADVADRFSRMEDGALKTSLAIQIFGKSGADLIPMLNEGRAGMDAFRAEADRLGITVSTKSAKAADTFGDNMTRLDSVLDGLANKIMQEVVPSLANLSNTFASPAFQDAIVVTVNGFLTLVDVLARTVVLAGEVANVLPKALNKGEDKLLDQMDADFASMSREDFNRKYQLGDVYAPGGAKAAPTPSTPMKATNLNQFKPIITDAAAAKKEIIGLDASVGKFTDSARTMASAIGDGLGSAFSRLADAVLSGNDALSATVDVLGDLGKQLVSSAITGFFGNLFTGSLFGGSGLGSGAIGRGTYGGSGGFFPAFPGLAGGTDNWRGGMTWVGEKGPELLNLPRGSQVVPNHELGGMGGGRSEMLVRLSPGLEAQILQKAAGQSVQIASEVVQQQSPAVNAKARRDKVI